LRREKQPETGTETEPESSVCACPPGGPRPPRTAASNPHRDSATHPYRQKAYTQILDMAHTHAQCQTVGNKLVPVVSLLSNNILMGINLKRLVGAGLLPLLLPPTRCCCCCCCLASRCWPLFRMRSTLLFFFFIFMLVSF